MRRSRSLWLTFGFAALLIAPTLAAEPSRYAARREDGSLLAGDRLTHWHSELSVPQLDDVPLLGAENPIVWLRNNQLPPAAGGGPVVEFHGGDRLPGEVVGYGDAGDSPLSVAPAHLMVQTATDVQAATAGAASNLRVAVRFVRRVVWEPRSGDRYRPNLVIYRDGRQLTYRTLRFSAAGPRLLTEQGIVSIEWSELAELHFPPVPPWSAYYDQLAALLLAPAGEEEKPTKIVRIETTAGLIATGTLRYWRATGEAKTPGSWVHYWQPAWCLDALPVAADRIRLARFLRPEQVPLSAIAPARVVRRSLFPGAWNPQADRNVRGGPLRGAGDAYGWGIGTLAYTEIEYPLPDGVKSFQTQLGLDESVGEGGCAVGRVYRNKVEGKPLFESARLIGGGIVERSPTIPLTSSAESPATLILVSDPASEDRPAEADPLNIRDQLNWLEPIVLLDPQRLAQQLAARRQQLIPAWDDWQVTGSASSGAADADGPVAAVSALWKQLQPARYGYLRQTVPTGESLTLSRKLTVPEGDSWLAIAVSRLGEASSTSRLKVEIGDQTHELSVPVRHPLGVPNPQTIPLGDFAGQEVEVRVTHLPQNDQGRVDWGAITLIDRPLDELLRPAPVDAVKLLEAQSYQVSLAWIKEVADRTIAGYRVYEGPEDGFELTDDRLVRQVPPNLYEINYLSPTPDATAWFAVETVDIFDRRGDPVYIKVDVPANQAPTNPLKLTAWPLVRGVLLSWHGDLEGDVREVEIHRTRLDEKGQPTGEWEQIDLVEAVRKNRYLDEQIEPGPYRYQVKARDKAGLVSEENPTVDAMSSTFARRINCGGPAIAAPQELDWEADDQPTTSSTPYSTQRKVDGVKALTPIYQTERWSYRDFGYHFPVPAGRYRVVLHFAEVNPYFFKPGSRKFDVLVNDRAVVESLDVVDKVGPLAAMQLEATTELEQAGEVQLLFRKGTKGPEVKAIEIYSLHP